MHTVLKNTRPNAHNAKHTQPNAPSANEHPAKCTQSKTQPGQLHPMQYYTDMQIAQVTNIRTPTIVATFHTSVPPNKQS